MGCRSAVVAIAIEPSLPSSSAQTPALLCCASKSRVTAVMKGIAAKWRALDEDEKAVWKAKADEDRKR